MNESGNHSGGRRSKRWTAADQNLLDATLAATPAQRLEWLEEAIRIAYASGALKPRVPKLDW